LGTPADARKFRSLTVGAFLARIVLQNGLWDSQTFEDGMLGESEWCATPGGSVGSFRAFLTLGGFLRFALAFRSVGFSGCGLYDFFGHIPQMLPQPE